MANTNRFLSVLLTGILLAGCATGAKKYLKQAERDAELGKFESAIENYKQAISDSANGKVDRNYVVRQIAESYRQTNRLDMATDYYKQLIDTGKAAENLFYYAKGMKIKGNYDVAKQYFDKYAEEGRDAEMVEWAKRESEGIDRIKEIAKAQTDFAVSNFSELNTENDEFGPYLYEGNLIFASNRGEQKTFEGDGTGYLDLYKYSFDGASESSGAIQPFGEDFNTTDAHEASVSITPDGRTIVFVRSNTGKKGDRAEVDIYYSRYHQSKWSKPELLPISDSSSWDGTPAFSPNGKALYFSSNRKGGIGGLDLYTAILDDRGRIRDIKNLGPGINTPGDEMFPYVSETGHLFFASDGHPGLGGLDLFRAEKSGSEISITNMGKPVNSNRDDFSITLVSPIEGYFSSNREGGKGGDDIYYFKEKDVVLKVAFYYVEGEVEDQNEVAMEGVKVELRNMEGEVIKTTTTDKEGRYLFPVEAARNYVIYYDGGESYFKKEEPFSTHGRALDQDDMEKDTNEVYFPVLSKMKKIEVGETVVLNNVYYEYNKAEVKEESLDELDKVITMLKDNPKLKIEISAHTDTRGSDDYNLNLSQARAESVVNYVVEGGIEQERLIAKGYGETKPIITGAETEEEHAKNRRTEFKVIGN